MTHMATRAGALAALARVGAASVSVRDEPVGQRQLAKRSFVIPRGDSIHTVTIAADPQDWELALLARQLPLANRGQRVAALSDFADGRPVDLDLQHPLKAANSGDVSPQRNRD